MRVLQRQVIDCRVSKQKHWNIFAEKFATFNEVEQRGWVRRLGTGAKINIINLGLQHTDTGQATTSSLSYRILSTTLVHTSIFPHRIFRSLRILISIIPLSGRSLKGHRLAATVQRKENSKIQHLPKYILCLHSYLLCDENNPVTNLIQ